jgi:hypothetical protein
MSKGEEREFRLRPRKPPTPRQKGDRLAWAMAFKTVVVIGTGRKCISEVWASTFAQRATETLDLSLSVRRS